MKTNGKSKLGRLVAVVVLLFTVLAVGIGIKLYQPHRAEFESQVEQQQTKPAETHPQEEGNRSEMTQEDEEFLQWLDEEIEKLEEEEETETMAAEEEPEDMPEAEPVEHEAQEARGKEAILAEEEAEDIPVAEPVEDEAQETKSFGGWRDVWADLNLTEEEQARLREGFKLAMQRWQNMSPEEREEETARLRAMGERWENMSEEERQEASERMRDRFEEWRQSGRVELPELSLD